MRAQEGGSVCCALGVKQLTEGEGGLSLSSMDVGALSSVRVEAPILHCSVAGLKAPLLTGTFVSKVQTSCGY